jgi:hypothetical protein
MSIYTNDLTGISTESPSEREERELVEMGVFTYDPSFEEVIDEIIEHDRERGYLDDAWDHIRATYSY